MRILIVEDEPEIAAMYLRGLELRGHEVLVAPDLAAATNRLAAEPDVVLLDFMLGRRDGLEWMDATDRADMGSAKVVLLSNFASAPLTQAALARGVDAVWNKVDCTPAVLHERLLELLPPDQEESCG